MSGTMQQKALAYFERGKLAKAKTLYKKISKREPADEAAWIMLGIINRKLGLPAAAATCYHKALAIHPDRPETLNNLGNVRQEQGSSAAAIKYFTKAVAIKPDYVDALANLGNAYLDGKDYAAALDCFQRLLSMQADFPGAQLNLGLAYFQQHDFAAAESCYRKALAINPCNPLNQYNLSQALYVQMKFEEALVPCRESVRLQPGDAASWLQLGVVLAALDRIDKATEAFARAKELDAELVRGQMHQNFVKPIAADALLPDNTPLFAFIRAGAQRLNQCDWSHRDEFIARLVAITKEELKSGKTTSLLPFVSLSLPLAPELQLAVARSRSQAFAKHMRPTQPAGGFQFEYHKDNRPLRIGYLSSDFRDHPVGHLIRGLFGTHRRDDFLICAYSTATDDGSEYRQAIAADCDRFVELTAYSNAEAARIIHQDGIQILVDLNGFTKFTRQEILAQQPAPVQVNYLGFPGTAGAPYIQYMLADPVVVPDPRTACVTEKLVMLPECFQINDCRQAISSRGVTRRENMLPDTGFVFGCFNKEAKIEPVLFDVWMKILHQVPDSILWLSAKTAAAQRNLRREAAARGIAGERLVFAERVDSKADHLERHRLADLCLDTRLFNGHVTTSDALWAGVPVLTCPQQSFASRVAASQLTSIGLPELIADTLEDYE
ncbi:MAG: tetratricopeptide repeat protein, partial [Gammaproteobacteria bacterium]